MRESRPVRRCPGCQQPIAYDWGEAAKCPNCGRWISLPRNTWLADLSEMPAMAVHAEHTQAVPWKELSPSIGFVLAIVAVGFGLHFSNLALAGLGALLIPACLFAAAVLELRSDRMAGESEGPAGAANMLHASSDWMAIRSRRRARE